MECRTDFFCLFFCETWGRCGVLPAEGVAKDRTSGLKRGGGFPLVLKKSNLNFTLPAVEIPARLYYNCPYEKCGRYAYCGLPVLTT